MHKNLDTLSDEELVKLSSEGDKEAEDFILQRYKNYVRIKARPYYLIGADNDDVVQEGMIGLYKAVRDFDPEKKILFKTFADICVTRQILTAIRCANRNKHSPLNAYVSMSTPVFGDESYATLTDVISKSHSANPEEMYILDETVAEIKEGIKNKLSEFENQVLNLYLDGISYSEISKMMDKSPKSIDNALQRIKKKLISLTTG